MATAIFHLFVLNYLLIRETSGLTLDTTTQLRPEHVPLPEMRKGTQFNSNQ